MVFTQFRAGPESTRGRFNFYRTIFLFVQSVFRQSMETPHYESRDISQLPLERVPITMSVHVQRQFSRGSVLWLGGFHTTPSSSEVALGCDKTGTESPISGRTESGHLDRLEELRVYSHWQ